MGELSEDRKRANITLLFEEDKNEDLETISKHMTNKLMGSGQRGLPKGKSCFISLTAFYSAMTGLVEEQWMLFTSASVRLLTLSAVTSSQTKRRSMVR